MTQIAIANFVHHINQCKYSLVWAIKLIKLIPLKFWISLFVYLILGLISIVEALTDFSQNHAPWFTGIANHLSSPSILTILIVVLLTIASLPIFWRPLWKLPVAGSWLSNTIFPDINGEWEFTLSSNYPLIENRNCAEDEPKSTNEINSQHKTEDIGLKKIKLRASIRQSFIKTDVLFHANDESDLKQSKTIHVELLNNSAHEDKCIVWTYEQTSKSDRKKTDPNTYFYGSAHIRLDKDKDYKYMSGLYWTNRNWTEGFNTAGEIEGRIVECDSDAS